MNRFRNIRYPQRAWLVGFHMVVTLAVFSPFAFSARPSIKWPELVGLVIVLPVGMFALGYWRRPIEYRLKPEPSIGFASLALATVALLVAFGHPKFENSYQTTLALVGMVAGPCYLILDAIERIRERGRNLPSAGPVPL